MSEKINRIKVNRIMNKECLLPLKGLVLISLGLLVISLVGLIRYDMFSMKVYAEQLARYALEETNGRKNQYILDAYRHLPLTFIPNAGQTDSKVRFYSRGTDYMFYFMPEEVVLAFVQSAIRGSQLDTVDSAIDRQTMWNDNFPVAQGDVHGFAFAISFPGANQDSRLLGRQELAGKVNYFVNNDPARWRTGLFTYREMVYHELWQGIDLVFRGEDGRLKYEFVLQPGARVDDIQLAFDGPEDVSLDQEGNLMIKTSMGVLTDKRPWSYQKIGGEKVKVESWYVLKRNGNGKILCGFELGNGYNPRYPLVIDPEFAYSTFLGGEGNDEGFDIAVDDSGNAYVTGIVGFTDEFPTNLGTFDSTFNGGFQDVFVTKLDASGTTLVYSTFLGGRGLDRGFGIDVDAQGNAYVTGMTGSFDFPTFSAFDVNCDDGSSTSFGACHDAFVVKLSADGSSLIYSTFLGGNGEDEGFDITVDRSGNAYVTGDTQSPDFPTLSPIFIGPPDDLLFDGGSPHVGNSSFQDAFVVKFDSDGSPVFSSFLGGSGAEHSLGIAVDESGNAYVTGATSSEDFPITDSGFDTSKNDISDIDAFVSKVGFNGSARLIYSTFLGGSKGDVGNDIAVDAAGNAYVTGGTDSNDFPTTAGAFDPTDNVDSDAFLAKLDASGANLIYSTYLGGSGDDEGYSIAVDGSGNAYVTAQTFSSDLPISEGAFDLTFSDIYVAKLDTNGDSLLFGTFLGGSGGIETGNGIAVDTLGNVYVTGKTGSNDFPTTDVAIDTTCGTDGLCNLGFDTFVVKLGLALTPAPTSKPTPVPTLEPTPVLMPTTITVNPTEISRSIKPQSVIVTVLDQNGKPLADVTINTRVEENIVVTAMPSSATTGNEGTARFECKFSLVSRSGKIIFSADDISTTLMQKKN